MPIKPNAKRIEHISSELVNTQSVSIGRSGTVKLDPRFKVDPHQFPSSSTSVPQALGSADKRARAGELGVVAGLTPTFSYTVTNKDKQGNVVTALTSLRASEKDNNSSWVNGHVHGQIASQYAFELQKKYKTVPTLAELAALTPAERAEDQARITYLAEWSNSDYYKNMYNNPSFYDPRTGYPGAASSYSKLFLDSTMQSAITTLIENHNRGLTLEKERKELDKLEHWTKNKGVTVTIDGKPTLETANEHDLAIATSIVIKQLSSKKISELSREELAKAIVDIGLMNERYDRLSQEFSGDLTVGERIELYNMDLNLPMLKQYFIDVTETKILKDRQFESFNIEKFRIDNKKDIDQFFLDLKNVPNLPKAQQRTEIDRLSNLVSAKRYAVEEEQTKYPSIMAAYNKETTKGFVGPTQQTGVSADHLIITNAFQNWTSILKWSNILYPKWSVGNYQDINTMPVLNGYIPPSLSTATTQPTQATTQTSQSVQPKKTFESEIAIMDNQIMKMSPKGSWSPSLDPKSANSKNSDFLTKQYTDTQAALKKDPSKMSMGELQGYMLTLRTIQGKQNTISVSKSDQAHYVLIDTNARTQIAGKMARAKARFTILQIASELYNSRVQTNHNKISNPAVKVKITADPLLTILEGGKLITGDRRGGGWTSIVAGNGDTKITNNETEIVERDMAMKQMLDTIDNVKMFEYIKSTKNGYKLFIESLYRTIGANNQVEPSLLNNTIKSPEYIAAINRITSHKTPLITLLNSSVADYHSKFDNPPTQPQSVIQPTKNKPVDNPPTQKPLLPTPGDIDLWGAPPTDSAPTDSVPTQLPDKVEPVIKEILTTAENVATSDDPNFVAFLTRTTGGGLNANNYKIKLSKKAMEAERKKWFKGEMKRKTFVKFVNDLGTNPKKLNDDQKLAIYKRWKKSMTPRRKKDIKWKFNYDGIEDSEELIDPRFKYPFYFDEQGEKTYFKPYYYENGVLKKMTKLQLNDFSNELNFKGEERLTAETPKEKIFLNNNIAYAVGAMSAIGSQLMPHGGTLGYITGALHNRAAIIQETRAAQKAEIDRQMERLKKMNQDIDKQRFENIKISDKQRNLNRERMDIYNQIQSIENPNLDGEPISDESLLGYGKDQGQKVIQEDFGKMLRINPQITIEQAILQFEEAPAGMTLNQFSAKKGRAASGYIQLYNPGFIRAREEIELGKLQADFKRQEEFFKFHNPVPPEPQIPRKDLSPDLSRMGTKQYTARVEKEIEEIKARSKVLARRFSKPRPTVPADGSGVFTLLGGRSSGIGTSVGSTPDPYDFLESTPEQPTAAERNMVADDLMSSGFENSNLLTPEQTAMDTTMNILERLESVEDTGTRRTTQFSGGIRQPVIGRESVPPEPALKDSASLQQTVLDHQHIRGSTATIEAPPQEIVKNNKQIITPSGGRAEATLPEATLPELQEYVGKVRERTREALDRTEKLLDEPQTRAEPEPAIEDRPGGGEATADLANLRRKANDIENQQNQLRQETRANTQDQDMAFEQREIQRTTIQRLIDQMIADDSVESGLQAVHTGLTIAAAAQTGYTLTQTTQPLIQFGYDYMFPTLVTPDNADEIDPKPDPPEPEPDPDPDGDPGDEPDDPEPEPEPTPKPKPKMKKTTTALKLADELRKKYGDNISSSKNNDRRSKTKGSRPLEDGELHFKNANFMGPGTKKKYMNYEPINRPDGVAKRHDKVYNNIEALYKSGKINDNKRKELIRKADITFIESLRKMGRLPDKEEESYRQVGLKGIQSKNLLENLFPGMASKILGEGLLGSGEADEPAAPTDEPARSQSMYKQIPAPPKPKPGQKKVSLGDLPDDLRRMIFKMRTEAMKDDKQKALYNKLLIQIQSQYSTKDTEKPIPKAIKEEYENSKKQQRYKRINEDHQDIFMKYHKKALTGTHVDKKRKKKPLDNFKRGNVGSNTGYRTLMKSMGNANEIVQAQRRKKMLTVNDEFIDLKDTKPKSKYNYKRIV